MSDQNVSAMIRAVALALLLVLAGGAASAQKFATVDELMAAVDARPEPATLQAELAMTITGGSGQSLSRTMRMWSVGDERRLIKFSAPADIAGSGFLMLERADGSDETMLYLPALGRVRRIAGGQQGDSFFGSDFAYEDITGIESADYRHTLLEVREGPVYVVEAIPTEASGSSYEKLVLEVPEAVLLPSRVTYYRGGAVVKVLTVSEVTTIGGYPIAGERRMESVAGGSVTSSTVIRQTRVALDETVPDEVFTERYLRR